MKAIESRRKLSGASIGNFGEAYDSPSSDFRFHFSRLTSFLAATRQQRFSALLRSMRSLL